MNSRILQKFDELVDVILETEGGITEYAEIHTLQGVLILTTSSALRPFARKVSHVLGEDLMLLEYNGVANANTQCIYVCPSETK